MSAYETLIVERRGAVGWLQFDRPDVGNAMNATMLDELERAWRELDADPDVRVIVNTGSGRAFQTGLDVVELSRNPEALREQSRRTKRAELRLTAWHNSVWKPVIAAVNGVCAGGGLHFVADADIVIASSNATFLDPHVSHRAGDRVRGDRAGPEVADGGDHAHGAHRAPRADAGVPRPTSSGSSSQVVDPPEQLARRGAGARREDRPELARRDARHEEGAVGRARARPHRRVPGRRRRARSPCGDTRTRKRDPLAFVERREARVAPTRTASPGEGSE